MGTINALLLLPTSDDDGIGFSSPQTSVGLFLFCICMDCVCVCTPFFTVCFCPCNVTHMDMSRLFQGNRIPIRHLLQPVCLLIVNCHLHHISQAMSLHVAFRRSERKTCANVSVTETYVCMIELHWFIAVVTGSAPDAACRSPPVQPRRLLVEAPASPPPPCAVRARGSNEEEVQQIVCCMHVHVFVCRQTGTWWRKS